MKHVCLGSAMWGWSIDEPEIFRILDQFYQSGLRYVDMAWNYPINGEEKDLSLACRILASWLEKTGVKDIKVIFKMGATGNSGEADNDLSSENLAHQMRFADEWFGENLFCAMVHWDNRTKLSEVGETIEFLRSRKKKGVNIGLSGICHPQLYLDILGSDSSDVYIQAKHNFIQSDIFKYSGFLGGGAKIFAYGISGSGLKLSADEYRHNSYVALVRDSKFHEHTLSEDREIWLKKVMSYNSCLRNLYHVGIACSELNNDIYGYIISPTSCAQLNDSLGFIKKCDFSKLRIEGI